MSFSEEEINGFVRIFFESKKISINRDSMIEDVLLQTGLSKESYGILIKKSIENSEYTRTKPDSRLTDAIVRYKNIIALEKKAKELELCRQYSVNSSTYYTILAAYQTDPIFQNTLVPHFEKYINDLK